MALKGPASGQHDLYRRSPTSGASSFDDDLEKREPTSTTRAWPDLDRRSHTHDRPLTTLLGRNAHALRRTEALIALVALYVLSSWFLPTLTSRIAPPSTSELASSRFSLVLDQCRDALGPLPSPPSDFHLRSQSDRFVPGTPDVIVRNATIWTGNANGTEILRGDVVLSRGLVNLIVAEGEQRVDIGEGGVEVDAKGKWLTPGIFDMHSHIGVDSLPELSGAQDTNSRQNPILPFLRSLDGFNTHDEMFRRARAGGVTTSLVLPGSANNIGGQAFMFKLRQTKEKTPASMMLEPPFNLPFAAADRRPGDPPRWRHMKNACGENIRRVYKQTRLDLAWNFRSALEKARSIKLKQDAFCARALDAEVSMRRKKTWERWADGSESERVAKVIDDVKAIADEGFPGELEWEALVDVLRGKVKVNTHCYEATDFQAYVDHTREFHFPLAAFHHAHEAYLVPDLLKQTYGGTPAVAVFAMNGRYKRESWRGSEFAPRILAENNITVIVKSDHPVLNSQYLIFEAQQAHHFGLPENLALAAVTTSPAKIQGIDHRIGYIRPGYDADLVLWDSHPLQLGATPVQVFIDGIAQLSDPFTISKPDLQSPPKQADLPVPSDPTKSPELTQISADVMFVDVARVYTRARGERIEAVPGSSVGVSKGRIACLDDCAAFAASSPSVAKISLANGTIAPGFIGFGPALGLADLISEASTLDGEVFDALETEGRTGRLKTTTPRAVDGLQFGGKHLLYAKRFGVTRAVTAPMGEGMFRGISAAFRTGSENALEEGAVIGTNVALHVTVGHESAASISTQIGVLRRLLLGSTSATPLPRLLELGRSLAAAGSVVADDVDYFALAGLGYLPLVVNVWKADHMATLLHLKSEIETNVASRLGPSNLTSLAPASSMRMIFHGGQESHLLAKEIASAGVGVIVSPPRPLPESWDERRATASIPLEGGPLPAVLERQGVKVAIGVPEEWEVVQLGWEAGWASRNSNASRKGDAEDSRMGKAVGKEEAMAWLTTNLEDMLGLPRASTLVLGAKVDFVAWKGDPLDLGSSVVAVAESGRLSRYS